MKHLLLLILLFPFMAFSQVEEEINAIDNEIDTVQARIDSLEQKRISAIQESVLQYNVAATINKMVLGLGQIEVSKDTLQTMMSRGANGNYYLHISDYTFPVDEARLLISVPDKNREVLKSLDINTGVIEILKLANESKTRIDGKPMPNERITFQ